MVYEFQDVCLRFHNKNEFTVKDVKRDRACYFWHFFKHEIDDDGGCSLVLAIAPQFNMHLIEMW